MKKGKKWTVESVIDEYLENAKPGKGKIYMPKGYKESSHKGKCFVQSGSKLFLEGR